MLREEKIATIEYFLSCFLNELDNEIISKIQKNYNQGKDLIEGQDIKEIENILYTKNRIENILTDNDMHNYYYWEEED